MQESKRDVEQRRGMKGEVEERDPRVEENGKRTPGSEVRRSEVARSLRGSSSLYRGIPGVPILPHTRFSDPDHPRGAVLLCYIFYYISFLSLVQS